MQIGQILQEARENKGISLDDLQQETKIQKRYLIAIEQNAFHSLPGNFYARAFIREYALAVDLDPKDLLAEFDESYQSSVETTTQYKRMDHTNRVKASKSSFWSIFPTVIVVLLIVGIVFVGWLLIQNSFDTNSEEELNQSDNNEIIRENTPKENEEGASDADLNNEDTTNNSASDDNEEAKDENAFSVVQRGEGETPLSEMAFVTSEDKVEISFDSQAPCYVRISDETDNVYYEGIIEPENVPDNLIVEDVEQLDFNIGNASGLTFFFNDQELEYPVDSQTVVQRLKINMKYNN